MTYAHYRLYLPDQTPPPSAEALGSGQGLHCWRVTSREPALSAVRAAIAARRSAALVPEAHGIRALFFDMDATIIKEESIDEMAKVMGVGPEVQRVTEAAMNGQVPFADALRQRVALLKGMTLAELTTLSATLTLNPGIRELVATAKKNGAACYIVSGGFTSVIQLAIKDIPFAGICANTLGVDNGVLSGTVVGPVIDGGAKRAYVARTAASLGLSPAAVAAIGDGANDRPMMQFAGLAFGINPKPILGPELDGACFPSDHRTISGFLWP